LAASLAVSFVAPGVGCCALVMSGIEIAAITSEMKIERDTT